MKKLLLLLFFIPIVSWSQEVPKEFQKMNTMVIQVDGDDPLLLIANKLMDSGFSIEEMNRDLGTIKTDPKAINSVEWQIRVRFKDGKAEFQNHTSMEISFGGVTSDGWDLTNFKSPRGPYGKISDGLYAIVGSINPDIEYFKK